MSLSAAQIARTTRSTTDLSRWGQEDWIAFGKRLRRARGRLVKFLVGEGRDYGFSNGGCHSFARALVDAAEEVAGRPVLALFDLLVPRDDDNSLVPLGWYEGYYTDHVVAKVIGLDLYLDERGARSAYRLLREWTGNEYVGMNAGGPFLAAHDEQSNCVRRDAQEQRQVALALLRSPRLWDI